jgi:hypothetical protein
VSGPSSGPVSSVAATPEIAPEVRALSRRLLPEADVLGERMADRLRAEIPLYGDGALVSSEQLVASCRDNTRFVLGQLAGESRADLAPRATGAARAEQGVPYAAVLQAFRVGGRLIWEFLVEHAEPETRDVLLRAAADVWAVSDELSALVTEAYRAALADKVRRDGQMRSVLVSSLLDGDTAAAEELVESAGMLRLQRGGEFVVVATETPTPGSEGLSDIEQRLSRRNVTSAWRLDHDHQDGLVELRPGFGADHLVEVLREVAERPVGVSAVIRGLLDAPDARRQARVACRAASPVSRDVVRFDQHPLAVLLAGQPDQTAVTASAVLGPVLRLGPEDGAVLLQTARTWLTADGSTSRAAERLHLHRNTVRYRLRRLEELTGRDLARPVDAAHVFVALECVRILGLDQDPTSR